MEIKENFGISQSSLVNAGIYVREGEKLVYWEAKF